MLNRACNQMGCLVGCWVVLGSIPLSAQEIASREPAGREPPSAIDFAQDIRPLLSDRCFACHGPDEQQRQSELRVDNLQSLLEDRGGYQVIAPGNTAESELLRRIEADDESEIMPPPETGKPLTPAERELLRQWIAEGAPWQQHWAYTPPRWHNPPQLTDAPAMAAQTQNWVDRFI
ncbi:MAG: hypothetical protein KDA45_15325, partial [Planctomycetales bacterium]|nr:hypothetical protein [Planctomycetales bacterium]